uniref:Impact N-terminal domain-containing protein n=1 Tax=Prymnesium polylepis TaxID=72548 RepID=A0A7S4MD44_9EUKA
MTAYRVVDAKGKVAKEYDDDGEAHGGQRLLGSLTKAKAVNVAVVVSRVYGGQNIGKARFEHICERGAAGANPSPRTWGECSALCCSARASRAHAAFPRCKSGLSERARAVCRSPIAIGRSGTRPWRWHPAQLGRGPAPRWDARCADGNHICGRAEQCEPQTEGDRCGRSGSGRGGRGRCGGAPQGDGRGGRATHGKPGGRCELAIELTTKGQPRLSLCRALRLILQCGGALQLAHVSGTL